MAGFGETYFAAFALAAGLSQVFSGLVTSVPLLLAGLFQLITPRALRYVKSYRNWVACCAGVQAATHLWFVFAALKGYISETSFFFVCVLYWFVSMSAGPVWNSWIESITEKKSFKSFIAVRSRLAQSAAFIAFGVAGLLLHFFKLYHHVLWGFALLFSLAALFRFVSTIFLSMQDDYFPEDLQTPKTPWRDLLHVLKDRNSGRFLFFLLLSQVSVHIAAPYFAPYMLAHIQFSYAEYVVLVAASYIAKIIAYPVIARTIDRYSAIKCLIISGLFVAPMPLFWFWTPQLPALVGIQVIAGFAWGTFELSSTMLVFSNIGSKERIRILTGYNLFNAICMVSGSLIGAYLLTSDPSYSTYRIAFTISAICRLLSLLALIGVKDIKAKVRVLAFRTLGLRPTQGSFSAPVIDSRDQSKRTD
jgi:MFS family permease